MKVNFYATLRQIAGQKTVEFDVPQGVTAAELLEAVLERYPSMRAELVDENGRLYRHVHLFVNGRDAPFLEDKIDTVIQPADKIDIFPAVGGGS
jgi:molybdopterin synthase sulfur carrier subunit